MTINYAKQAAISAYRIEFNRGNTDSAHEILRVLRLGTYGAYTEMYEHIILSACA